IKIGHAERVGVRASFVYNTTGAPIVMNGDLDSVRIPAVMIGAAEGQLLADRLVAGERIDVRLVAGLFIEGNVSGSVVADFSSRRPDLSEPDFVKPDVTAPGVEILGGHTPDVANRMRGETFQYLSKIGRAHV